MNSIKRIHLWLGLVIVLLAVVLLGTYRPVTADDPQPELLVIRLYYADQQMLNELAARMEPWEVNAAQQYILVDVTRQEYGRLRRQGFRVEIDTTLTAELNAPREPLPDQGGGIPGYPCYRTVEETFASAAALAANYPTLATWTDIGDSWDKVTPGGPAGYDLNVLRLTNSSIPGFKPPLLIFGAIHAREYTTAEMATRFAEYLLNNYGIDPDVTWLLDYHEVHLVLQANPDGRKRAEAGQSWRKNTNNADGCATTYGVDLNRNFDFFWNSGGSSPDPCSTTYHGSAAASEPETQAYQAYEAMIFPDQREDPITATAPITTTGIFIDLHSYAREILWPWGFTSNPPPNHIGMQTLARKMGYFNGYDATQSLYATSGTTKDFAYGAFGVPGYTIEMGTAFFQACTYFENTIVPEMLPTLLYAAKAARFAYITPAGPDVVNLALSAASVPAGTLVDITAVIDDTRYNNSQGTEPSQNIMAAEYYIDTPPWVTTTLPVAWPMTAVDGNFNNPLEGVTATLDTSGLDEGQHILFVRGQDAAGNWGAVSAAFLELVNGAPTASFTHDSPVATGQVVTFTNGSVGANLTFLWDFGDGTTSMEAHPTHSYAQAMTVTVTLTATNNLGTDVFSSEVVVMDPVTAVFTHTSPVTAGTLVTFTNQSTGENASYWWDFGDGATSTETHPSHVYAQAGVYTVTLTVQNPVSSALAASAIEVAAPMTMMHLYLPVIWRE